MHSFLDTASHPAQLPIVSDDVIELHVVRVLLLCHIVGNNNRIDGLTKFAKIDFLIRYPKYAKKFRGILANQFQQDAINEDSNLSPMIKYHYGPWDPRYYHLFAHMNARALLDIYPDKKTLKLKLTDEGQSLAKALAQEAPFTDLVAHMREIRGSFGGLSGYRLRRLIYEHLENELHSIDKGEKIQ